VYSLGAEGDLLCLDARSGKVVWDRHLKDDYKTESPIWGYSASPVIHGELLYVLAGGPGSLIVALDKLTGQERWRALSGNDIGYCPPTLVRAANQEQLIVWEPKAVHGLDPTTGIILWSYPLAPKYEMSIIPPAIQGDRMYLSGIGGVSAMLQLDTTKPGVKELWKGKPKQAIYAANGTTVFDGEYLYGADCDLGPLICARVSDGERMWETFAPTGGGDRRLSHGTCFLNKVGDLYYILSETGDFIIAKLTPEKYEEIGRFHVVDPTNECFGRAVVWSYPAYANRCLFVRNDRELVCYSIAEEPQ
jgi:outer membrane protein assembly factor BamB